MPDLYGSDAYSPKDIAERVENVGVVKARLPLLSQWVLGILAGGFIGLGGLLFTLVTADATLGFAASRLLGGLVFSLGLILVVIAGAELFTGNNLLAMAWTSGRISGREVLRNWVVIWLANFVGAAGLAVLVYYSNHLAMNGGSVAHQALKLAALKASLPFMEAFLKGILCNLLVCLAVWLAMAGRTVVDKVVAIVFPITAFVAAGFEHSIANMYFFTLGLLAHLGGRFPAPDLPLDQLTLMPIARNLTAVTLGNILGGSVLVALIYYLVYRRPAQRPEATSTPAPR